MIVGLELIVLCFVVLQVGVGGIIAAGSVVTKDVEPYSIYGGDPAQKLKDSFFIVVSDHGLIQERKIGMDEVIEFEVSGEKIEAVHMVPGYTHNIINLSAMDALVMVMWASEAFDPGKPDTYFELVK